MNDEAREILSRAAPIVRALHSEYPKPFRFINAPTVTSQWRVEQLWWCIEGEWISDHDLRSWCANNMGDSIHRHMDVARQCHMVAYASRNACKECGANGDYLRINWGKYGRCSICATAK